MENIQDLIQSNLAVILIINFSLIILLIIFSFASFLKIKKINERSKVFFEGKNGKDLEELVTNQQKSLKNLDSEMQELFEISSKIHNLAHRGVHKIGLVRFNPFRDMGGNQSFVIALLDGRNSGIILSSLYTREGTRIYTKSIINGKSDSSPLTDEEVKAISKANITKK